MLEVDLERLKFESSGGADGVTDVVVRGSLTARRARIQVKAKAAPLALPSLPLAKSPSVVAQVRTSAGGCWGAAFSHALTHDGRQFSARSD